ncbi:hypothetical protein [Bradyrhizobium sp. Gha]|uniref:hypothetical protein n=1 Tax=Bradyrhizobium sp. Gha TaxID=1855318 RepID=UPI001160E00D|nr:hypothetical protein [Bradyrhizobium sp. Gha]
MLKVAGVACLLVSAIFAWCNEVHAGDLPSLDGSISLEIAKDFHVPRLTLPFQKIKCRLGADGDCTGPAKSVAGIGLLTVISGRNGTSRENGSDQICAPSLETMTKVPESDTTKLGQRAYRVPAEKVRGELGQLLNVELPEGNYTDLQFIIIGAAQDQSDYPPPRFRREVAEACPGRPQLLVTRLIRARLSLAFDQRALLARPLEDALKKTGFVRGGPALPNLFVSTDVYLLGFFALPLSETP